MRFSIIVPHYDLSVSDEFFCRGIQSLLNQTNQDFEVLIYHDGPTSRPIPDIWKQFGDKCKLTITEKRKNDWGHSNRDLGIREANGEYIVHFNPDNILYDFALSEIENKIKESPKIQYPANNKIIVFPIKMIGICTNGNALWRTREEKDVVILTGYPCIKFNIDAMQLVMSKNYWINYGGWYDKSEQSDGNMYPKFVRHAGARYCDKILGEHW